MDRKIKGFSLAELLISLLVISIVLSAAIPTLTKKSRGSEQIWRWANTNNSAYFGVGSLQSAILGSDSIPNITNTFNNVDGIADLNNIRYTNSGDKLVILKQSTLDNANSHLMNSHISFYTLANSNSATTNDIAYVGRLALEKHNMALGIGSLQSLNDTSGTFLGNNTALGHYTLLRNRGGLYNTAVGEKALANAQYAKHNTAVGYEAGLNTDRDSTSLNDDENAVQNTAIGSQALRDNIEGRANTAVGFAALRLQTTGLGSTAVGSQALFNSVGTGNTALGMNSCYNVNSGSYNMCLGYNSDMLLQGTNNLNVNADDNYNLFIGSYDDVSGTSSVTPLIYGRMQTDYTNNLPREVILSTTNFDVRTFDGAQEILHLEARAGDNGYTNNGNYDGILNLVTHRSSSGESYLNISGDAENIKIDTNNDAININDNLLAINFYGDDADSQINFYTTAKKLDLFNNKIFLETASNARIDITESYGIDITNSGSNISINNNGDIYIHSGSNHMDLTSTGAVFNTNVKVGGVTISSDSNDIEIPSISGGTGGQLVGNNITQIWQRLTALENRVNGAYSDERLKDISGDSTIGLKEINALEVKNYTYKNDENKTPHVGVIAQQLQKVFPNSVFADDKGYLKIKTEEIFYAMVNSIKELFVKIQDLTAKVTGLDKRITELEVENAQLKQQNIDFELRLKKLEEKVNQ